MMVALRGTDIVRVPIADAVARAQDRAARALCSSVPTVFFG